MKSKTKTQQEKEYSQDTMTKSTERAFEWGYKKAKQEAEAKQKEFIEKLKEITKGDEIWDSKKGHGFIIVNDEIDKLSQEVFGKSEVGK